MCRPGLRLVRTAPELSLLWFHRRRWRVDGLERLELLLQCVERHQGIHPELLRPFERGRSIVEILERAPVFGVIADLYFDSIVHCPVHDEGKAMAHAALTEGLDLIEFMLNLDLGHANWPGLSDEPVDEPPEPPLDPAIEFLGLRDPSLSRVGASGDEPLARGTRVHAHAVVWQRQGIQCVVQVFIRLQAQVVPGLLDRDHGLGFSSRKHRRGEDEA